MGLMGQGPDACFYDTSHKYVYIRTTKYQVGRVFDAVTPKDPPAELVTHHIRLRLFGATCHEPSSTWNQWPLVLPDACRQTLWSLYWKVEYPADKLFWHAAAYLSLGDETWRFRDASIFKLVDSTDLHTHAGRVYNCR